MPADLPPLRLHGVHHTAFPTAKPKETIEFFRDTLGLQAVHAITAKGWGWKDGYPDFFHFFFDAGNGSTIAYFYHIGSPPPVRPENPLSYQAQARHTAWIVETDEEMRAWHAHLKNRGVKVTPQIAHEVIESIYFLDPNEYPFEITRPMRGFEAVDHSDAALSLEAIAETFGPNPAGTTIIGPTIEDMWRLKAAKVRERFGFDPQRRLSPAIYVLDVPEYRPLVEAARGSGDFELTVVGVDYVCISCSTELRIARKDVDLRDALWFSLLVGGLCGSVTSYTSAELRLSV